MNGCGTAPLTNVVVIGAGYWGMNHIRVFSELADARVLAVCDSRPDRLDFVRRRFPVTVTDDVEAAVSAPEVDAVVVATNAASHRPLAGLALAAGKHVLVEKPLTTTSRDASELIDLAKLKGKTLMVGHTFLFNPGVRTVKEYLDADEIGQVYYLYSRRTGLGPIRSDVNAVWDLAPHDIAILNYLLGSLPMWVSAVGTCVLRERIEDVGFITLGYPGGVLGHVHISWADPNKVREVVVVGSDKRIVFNDLDALERVRVFDKGVKPLVPEVSTSFGEHALVLRDGAITSPLISPLEPLKHQCGNFIHSARGRDVPFTDGAQGLEVVRVLEAVDESMERNGAPVTVSTRTGAEAAARAVSISNGQFEEVVRELSRPLR